MNNHILRLGRQTLVYGLGAAAPSLLGLLTLPVVARRLDTTQYGIMELALTAVGVAGILVELGLTSASQRSFYDHGDDQPDRRRLVLSTALLAYTATTVVAALALIAARDPLAQFLFNSSHEADLIVIAAAALPATALVNFSREVMRLHFRVWHFLASSVIAGFVGAGFTLFALLVLNMKVAGVLLGGVTGALVGAIYGFIVVRPDLKLGFSRRELRIMLDYGIPLLPIALALWALALIDRIMLSKLSSLSQVGEYAIANRLGLLLTLATTALGTAFVPFTFSLFSEDPEEERLIRARTLTYTAVAFALLTLIVSLFAREIIRVIAPGYTSAYEAVGLVSFGLAVNGIGLVAGAGIGLARRTRTLIWLAIPAAAVNIAINFAVIPAWGMLGAAFATAVAYTLLFGLYYLRSQQVYHTPYQLGRLVRLGILTAVAAAVGAIPIEPLGLALSIKTAVFVAFLIALRLTGVVKADELGALRSIVRWRIAVFS